MINIATVNSHRVIYGYSKYLNSFRIHKKRALLSYLTTPVAEDLNGQQTVRFSNSGIALSWAHVLNELGYAVDIVNWDDRNFRPDKKYDLVVFHGGKNFKNINEHLKNKPTMIYFSTGSYWKFNNKAEDKRIKDFEKRHGVKIGRDRYIYDSEDPVNSAARGIIVLGDPSMRSTYPKYPIVLTINNASYPDDHYDQIVKDYNSARKNFLFFAGSGNIHKGLDLLIDSFKSLKEHLYIVTVTDKKVLDVFKKELALPNIHLIGQVNMRDPKFYEIVDKCAFVILPSCSEGQAGSVVEAMNQGLIPIVSKETRLEASKYGVVLDDNSIACIKKTVKKMSALEPSVVQKMAKEVRKVAVEDHNPEKFKNNLKKAVREVLAA